MKTKRSLMNQEAIPGWVGSESAGQSGILRASRKSQTLPAKVSKNSLTTIKHMRGRPSPVSRMLLTTLRGLHPPVRIMPGQMTFRRRAEKGQANCVTTALSLCKSNMPLILLRKAQQLR